MRHIISLQLENESGALSRVAGLFSARGFNIESLTVAPTNDETLSRMTIVSIGDDNIIEQIVKQLDKLIDVVTVINLTATEHIERELVLVKIDVNPNFQAEIDKHIDEYGGKIVDVSKDTYTVEVVGKSQRVSDFLEAIDALKILEVSRTGVTGVCQKREY
ncbi:Acetolactate synthase small subunit (EC [uncultured Gammaproteobacteria bacterium]|jgi:acetolactate synthase-1/3 small subunit|nr:Acetolactate synthase small subunit (EC 2.2.1.6) [uncultured Gammaproteobacteria bacterium]CAC9473084.1 Acetolactate synthase small subunit (EC 2.2.1.6) [uncultured Gammaproteobacteria bacterium]VVH66328.1 Acetolactate synthase small subunit (EC [uncultured Gammaproteobacteria bacterium]